MQPLRLPKLVGLLAPAACFAWISLFASADSTRRPISSREIRAFKAVSPPVIDGDLSEPVWAKASQATEFTDTYDGAPEEEPTFAWVAYDEINIYVAFRCKHAKPDSIVAQQTRKGGFLGQDDNVEFTINPFGTRRGEDESVFMLNPLGTQDCEIAGGRASKEEWQGAWKGAAKRAEDGWTAEMAIPWSILTHPSGGSSRSMDVNFRRHIAAQNRRFEWSNMGPNRRREFTGRWLEVQLPRMPMRNPLSILGYNFTGREESGGVMRSGLDGRYEINPQLSLVGTLNPDFANIEGDVERIDFSYAEQLRDERRPFFLEGENYFDDEIFAPQRIPQFDAGLKLYGKTRPNSSIGVLGTFARGREDGVFRWRESLSPNVSYGMGYVHRSDSEFKNDVWQVNGRSRKGNWSSNWRYSRSGDLESDGEQWNGGVNFNNGRFGTGIFLDQTSPGYRARDGYVPFNDQRGLNFYAYYGGQYRTGAIREWNTYAVAEDSRHFDGSFFTRSRSIGTGFRLANDLRLRLNYSREGFEEFRDHVTTVGFRYPANDFLHSFGLNYSFGSREGAPYLFLAPSFNYRFGQRLTLGLSMMSIRHTENADLDVLTLNYDINKKQSIGGRLVRRNTGTNWYASFRQGGYGGLEYFFILGDPNAERFTSRFVLKVVSPLTW